ncbi:TrbI/VirB10 family protein [Veillonella sp. VA142]|uniref:TrbI/VirB10 family protein n=1 Tax=Veillonella sp. VA142 TaxID=741834 RepID=UPI000F8E8CFE|nr:TrbI/VirB10 family protein [Veillonella sp. VA142]
MDDNNKTTVIPTIIQPSTDSTVTDNSSTVNVSEGPLPNPDTTSKTTTEALNTSVDEAKVYTEEDFYFDEDEVLDRDRGTNFNYKKIGLFTAIFIFAIGGGVFGFKQLSQTPDSKPPDPPIATANSSNNPAANLSSSYREVGENAKNNHNHTDEPTHMDKPSNTDTHGHTHAPIATVRDVEHTPMPMSSSTSQHEEDMEKIQKEKQAIDMAPIAFKIASAVAQGQPIPNLTTSTNISNTNTQNTSPIYTNESYATADTLGSHMLHAGSVIQATLLTGISTDIPNNEIVAVVRQDIYDSLTGTHLLIPQGSKIIGQAGGAGGKGIKRIGVTFNRIILPNGNSITLPNLPAIDGTGMPGLKDIYDSHTGNLLRTAVFGTMVSAIAQSATGNTGGSDSRSPGQEAVSGGVKEIQDVISDLVKRSAQNQITIEIRPGKEFSLFVTQDISIPEYTSEYR